MREEPRGALRKGLDAFSRGLSWLEFALLFLAGVAVVAMMVIIVAAAGSRYILNSPITGAEVIVGVFLAPLVTYLALPSGLRHRQHVGVTFLVTRMGRLGRRISQIVGAVIVAAVFLVVGYQGWLRTWSAYTSGAMETNVGLPLWLAYISVPVGCGVMAILALVLAATWSVEPNWKVSLAQADEESHQLDFSARGNTKIDGSDSTQGNPGRRQ